MTNKHANTQIPEILGAARVWEVTGDGRFREVVEVFWACAVTQRGYYCTGAGDDGELWGPPGQMAERMGVGQEHCVNYNMMRLAHVLLRWTGEPQYADYWERRFYNGVLAHQHGETGMISYFLGIGAGSHKKWGSLHNTFGAATVRLFKRMLLMCSKFSWRIRKEWLYASGCHLKLI